LLSAVCWRDLGSDHQGSADAERGSDHLVMILSLVHFNPLTLFADAEQKYTAKYLLPGTI